MAERGERIGPSLFPSGSGLGRRVPPFATLASPPSLRPSATASSLPTFLARRGALWGGPQLEGEKRGGCFGAGGGFLLRGGGLEGAEDALSPPKEEYMEGTLTQRWGM